MTAASEPITFTHVGDVRSVHDSTATFSDGRTETVPTTWIVRLMCCSRCLAVVAEANTLFDHSQDAHRAWHKEVEHSHSTRTDA